MLRQQPSGGHAFIETRCVAPTITAIPRFVAQNNSGNAAALALPVLMTVAVGFGLSPLKAGPPRQQSPEPIATDRLSRSVDHLSLSYRSIAHSQKPIRQGRAAVKSPRDPQCDEQLRREASLLRRLAECEAQRDEALQREAAAIDTMARFREQLTCGICLMPYCWPVLLQCGHCFCAACASRWESAAASSGKVFSCPTCRSPSGPAIQDRPLDDVCQVVMGEADAERRREEEPLWRKYAEQLRVHSPAVPVLAEAALAERRRRLAQAEQIEAAIASPRGVGHSRRNNVRRSRSDGWAQPSGPRQQSAPPPANETLNDIDLLSLDRQALGANSPRPPPTPQSRHRDVQSAPQVTAGTPAQTPFAGSIGELGSRGRRAAALEAQPPHPLADTAALALEAVGPLSRDGGSALPRSAGPGGVRRRITR